MRLIIILAGILVTLPMTASARTEAGQATKSALSSSMRKASYVPTVGRMVVTGEKPRTKFMWHVRRERTSVRPIAITPRVRVARTPLVKQQRHDIAVVMAKARHSTDPVVVKMLENLLERLQRGDNIGAIHQDAMKLAMLSKLRSQQNEELRKMGKPKKQIAKDKRTLNRELLVLRRLEGPRLQIFPIEKGKDQLRRLGQMMAQSMMN
jgi:hypothetical protein